MLPDLFTSSSVRRILITVLIGWTLLPLSAAADVASTTTAITISGEITDTGGSVATERGVVYGITPSYGATTTESGSFSTGAFSVSLTDLSCNTTYHYATY